MSISKRIISVLLATVMLFGMLPSVAVSATEAEPAVIEETVSTVSVVETQTKEETEPMENSEEMVESTEEPTIDSEETTEIAKETASDMEEETKITDAIVSDMDETVTSEEEIESPIKTEEQLEAMTFTEEVAVNAVSEEAVSALVLEANPTCVIDTANPSKVSVSVEIASGNQTDDSKLYLFAVPAYVDSVSGQNPVASATYAGSGEYEFSIDLNDNTATSLLYSKFYIGVKTGGEYVALNAGSFITNPELIASSKVARTKTASKKGIHMTLSIPTDIETLGIKQGYFNISFADFISNTPTDCAYTYNGKTYYFNGTRIGEYDNLIDNMSKAGIAITISLLNEYSADHEYLIHPGVSKREGTVNYAINTSTQQGLETVAAAMHFLAERYNGNSSGHGKVDNWIVGNEVNDNLMYYYMGHQDVDTFVQEYLQSFRVMYTAIKSAYSNANVYICLQHRWNTEDSTGDYGGKNFIDKFNAYAKAQGDIDWGLSYHPYSFPMNDADILNDGAPSVDSNGKTTDGGEVKDSVTTPIITMKNIDILTDYFHNTELKNPAGEVRSLIMGEMGYTSYSNISGEDEEKQAANIALAYYKAEMNADIDAFLLRTHTDENEGSPYYKFGLRNQKENGQPGTEKYAYEMYKYIDTAETLKYTQFAKAELGISDWAEVVDGWNPDKFNSMGTRKESVLYSVTDSSNTKDIVNVMLHQWEPSYNVFEIGEFDYEPIRYPNGVAVANSFAYYMDYQGIEKHFDNPLSLQKYLLFDVNFKTMDASGASDKLELKIRLYSGNDVLDTIGTVDVNKDYTVCVDVEQWDGKSSIDTMEVMIREEGKEKSFAGTFTVYNVKTATSVSGMKPLGEVDEGGDTEKIETTPMYRLYNPNSGEHFYTGSIEEKDNLVTAGWQYEGIAWNAPVSEGDPVYRVYNPNSGDHHYTMSMEEVDMLKAAGWKYEGVCWNSASPENVPLYRLYNPNADCGSHHYTGSTEERDYLVSLGWIYEGIGWFGIA